MPQSREFLLHSNFVVKEKNGVMTSIVDPLDGCSIQPVITQEDTKVVEYLDTWQGELVINTRAEKDDYVFDVNAAGQLIAISPYDVDLSINEVGELVAKKI